MQPTVTNPRAGRLGGLKKPVAIAMWDFSWLLRHHRYGDFADWDRVLDELAERGYDAIRADVFPHLVAAGPDGKVVEEFYCPHNGFKGPDLWGNNVSVRVRPRDALLEFLPKCRERGIKVGLATWFLDHGTGRSATVEGMDGFVRVWNETLQFLDAHGLMDVVLYVDILNEYPNFHGFRWLFAEVKRRGGVVSVSAEDDEDAHIWKPGQSVDPAQRSIFVDFIAQALDHLSARWPGLGFFPSLTYHNNGPDHGLGFDFSRFGALDYHIWMVHHQGFADAIHYFDNANASWANDRHFEQMMRDLVAYRHEHWPEMVSWMDGKLGAVAALGRQHGIPCGNTEGWGPIGWIDHPFLDWEWVKESGAVCAELAVKHGFRFICTSNFTHPHFTGIWDDVPWHRKVTGIIRG